MCKKIFIHFNMLSSAVKHYDAQTPTERKGKKNAYVSLERISLFRKRGWKLSESTPLFQRRILLAESMYHLSRMVDLREQ
jgi:hypothetical protein